MLGKGGHIGLLKAVYSTICCIIEGNATNPYICLHCSS